MIKLPKKGFAFLNFDHLLKFLDVNYNLFYIPFYFKKYRQLYEWCNFYSRMDFLIFLGWNRM